MPGAPTLILKAGQKLDTLAGHPGDFEDWIAAGLGGHADEVVTVDVRAAPPLPSPGNCARVLVTGSAAMVSDREPWAEATAAWLREAVAAGTPVLGICFGHQLLAHALGGEAGWNPNGVEVGSVEVKQTPAAGDDPLLGGLPTRFMANMSHRQSVLVLPDGAVRLAHSALDPNAAFRFGDRAWGVQFHPEFDATVTRAHVDWYRPALAERGADAGALLAEGVETPLSHGLLARFAAIA
ncbi:MAG: glutamine amidotransferase [Gammaproteobacteria bacterium]|nr:glutamine amidotransferase [Gammaproteobacteria bacterium]